MTPYITNEQIEQWIEDAKKTTRGKWVCDSDFDIFDTSMPGDEQGSNQVCSVPYGSPNGIHISNACPENFIAVLEELKKHRKRKHFEDVRCGGIGVEIK